LILENVRIWCKHLGSSEEAGPVRAGEWTPAKNMTEWSNYLSYDIMGDLIFGKKFEYMERDEHRYVPGLMMRATEFVYVVRDRSSIKFKERKERERPLRKQLGNANQNISSSASFHLSPSSALSWAHGSWT
jgi:hypothetical protein